MKSHMAWRTTTNQVEWKLSTIFFHFFLRENNLQEKEWKYHHPGEKFSALTLTQIMLASEL